VAGSTFTLLCNHLHYPSPELSHLPRLKLYHWFLTIIKVTHYYYAFFNGTEVWIRAWCLLGGCSATWATAASHVTSFKASISLTKQNGLQWRAQDGDYGPGVQSSSVFSTVYVNLNNALQIFNIGPSRGWHLHRLHCVVVGIRPDHCHLH
jgi:hypothetical protein